MDKNCFDTLLIILNQEFQLLILIKFCFDKDFVVATKVKILGKCSVCIFKDPFLNTYLSPHLNLNLQWLHLKNGNKVGQWCIHGILPFQTMWNSLEYITETGSEKRYKRIFVGPLTILCHPCFNVSTLSSSMMTKKKPLMTIALKMVTKKSAFFYFCCFLLYKVQMRTTKT